MAKEYRSSIPAMIMENHQLLVALFPISPGQVTLILLKGKATLNLSSLLFCVEQHCILTFKYITTLLKLKTCQLCKHHWRLVTWVRLRWCHIYSLYFTTWMNELEVQHADLQYASLNWKSLTQVSSSACYLQSISTMMVSSLSKMAVPHC